MADLKNRVTLIGHVGATPEITDFSDNGLRATFAVATNESFKNDHGERVTETQWHNVVAWNGLAKLCKDAVTKGSYVILEGKLSNRSFTDGQGARRYKTEVIISDINFLGVRP